jgi:hypothetical protein
MTILQLQVAESSIEQQGDSCLQTTKIDQSNKENEGTLQGEKKGEKTRR